MADHQFEHNPNAQWYTDFTSEVSRQLNENRR